MARRAAFLRQSRTDSTLNLTVEAGNFSPVGHTRSDTLKVEALAQFYRTNGYDAVALSTRELMFGLAEWKMAHASGLPVVAANIFKDKKLKKPLFNQVSEKLDQDAKLACIGLVTESAWKTRQDSAVEAYFKSPYEMQKLVTKVAKKCDHLTLVGEFTPGQCDTLARLYPDVDLIVSSGIKSGDRPREVGHTVIVGSQSRGYYANFVEYKDLYDRLEDSTATRYRANMTTLDPNLPEDTTTVQMITRLNQQIKTPVKQ